MRLKKDWLFRLEFFGGLLINRKTFERYELTFDEALYLKAVNYLDSEEAIKVVSEILHKENIDLSRIVGLDVLENYGDTMELKCVYEIVDMAYRAAIEKTYLSFPLEVTLYPSMVCNLNCKFCFLGSKTDKKVYGADKWAKIVQESKERGALSISILGGEPSLYFDIDKLLLECERNEINTVITTNAQVLKNSTKDIIINSKYIVPAVSIQSLDNLNTLLMGCTSDKQQKFVEECVARGKEVRINSVYTFQTERQIEEIYDYCVEQGVFRYSVANYANTKNNPEMLAAHSLRELDQLDKHMREYIREKYPKNTKLPQFSAEGCMLYSCYADSIIEKIELSPFEKQYYSCRGKYTNMEIYSDGSVYPCFRFETVTKSTSNVFEDSNSLDYIWQNDFNYNEIRKQKTENPDCLKCSFVSICEGGCYPSRLKKDKYNLTLIKDPNCQFN